jgi:hypothetical protein
VAKDVCDVLKVRTQNVIRYLNPEDVANTLTRHIMIPGVNRGVNIINESGLYSLILKSRKPQARRAKGDFKSPFNKEPESYDNRNQRVRPVLPSGINTSRDRRGLD